MPGNTLLMVGNFASTGVRAASADIADGLAARGWDVLRVSTRVGRAQRLSDMLLGAFRLRHSYAAAHLDVFSGRAFIWAESVAWLLRRLHKPYVLTLRGGSLPRFGRRWPRRTGALLRSAAAVTAPSEYLRQAMHPYHDGVRVLPNGLDAGRYPFTLRSTVRPRLVWVRAFHRIYNPELAPAVLAVVSIHFPEARLVMIGPDRMDGSRARTEAAARRLGVADRITMVGPVAKSEIPARLAGADVFINTPDVDNMPVTVLEALAAGLCVVSTRVGGIPDLVEHDVDALLVPPGDADAMAAAVRRVLSEPGLAERLSGNGRARALACDWSAVLPQWEALLASVCAPVAPR